ncbi:phospho-sugar mutase [Rhodococcus sp. BP-252]|uniref:phospho-sugar mutase n=1 Tax=Nocardiaceae TaxID=85025 RepID=UPI0012ECCDA5|nr:MULTISPECIES: phospho-sugar mutase [Rhodococcus]MBY6413843.1 phospho-sugar mutase [Rhodococcus sp. BP-320]MBY6419263.1 phospho-sugar mutase [Rhodococcus sp. BP-321]MBY6424086.1 phospho-sugar mutase [Rhodococcus sp. BP-324]MBY6428584.1 phospho-sugar mutase [Rhodococcus sp. BP-323]MBY6434336.1 phospho-sugar mutase [Rhodococcus sp. BP-322]
MAEQVAAWIAGDPDPSTREELSELTDDELAERFRAPLSFGTAGLRGEVRAGPNGMNVAVVVRTSAGIGAWLQKKCLGGSTVVVGRDARHGSETFATAAAETLAAQGFSVVLLPRPLPTPVLAFAVRALGADLGVQITASHNPAADNGYKVYLRGGAQLVPPADKEIEAEIAAVGPAVDVPRTQVSPGGSDVAARYLDTLPALVRSPRRAIRIALTPLHGVGGELALTALRGLGFRDIHVVESQFAPDPEFPTVAFPNPEESGAADAVLALAAEVNADLAIALDPDADRCAIGIPGPTGWRMLTGDETGALLADHILTTAPPNSLVANTIVSSQLLAALAPARGARYARTLTGFKWLVRAGQGLVYAYEEAIGHCVDPEHVLDKDGISGAVVLADLTALCAADGRTLQNMLDDLAVEFGVHAGAQVSKRVTDLDDIASMMKALRATPPTELAGIDVTVTDFLSQRGPLRTDAVELAGDGIRVVVRPSGTEPKVKAYLEAVVPVADRAGLADARAAAESTLEALKKATSSLVRANV